MFAQNNNPFNNARQTVGGSNVSAFNQNRMNNFNDYRQRINAEYIRLTREQWRDFNSYRGLVQSDKDEKPVVPVKMSDEDAKQDKQDNRIDINGLLTPIKNNSKPQPVAPVQEIPRQ